MAVSLTCRSCILYVSSRILYAACCVVGELRRLNGPDETYLARNHIAAELMWCGAEGDEVIEGTGLVDSTPLSEVQGKTMQGPGREVQSAVGRMRRLAEIDLCQTLQF